MKPITNEIQFFGTSQRDVMVSMANAIITNYNEITGEALPIYKNYVALIKGESYSTKNVSALDALIRKLNNIALGNGDPLSIPVFLKTICKGKTKVQAQPGGLRYEPAIEVYGKGHFRWDWQAYTLTDNELKAARQYVNGRKEKATTIASNGFNYKGLSISAKLKAIGVHAWGDKDMFHNKFWITVTNMNNNETVGFDFYGSHQDHINKVTEITGKDVLSAFDCFISDALAAENGFDDFCSEFGYDNDSRSAERIYDVAHKTLNTNHILNNNPL